MKPWLVLVLALATQAPAVAFSCDKELTSTYSSRCLNAFDVANYSSASVWCRSAAEQFGICSDDFTGSLRFGYIALKARALSAAAIANARSGDRATASLQLRVARALASDVIRSRSAQRDDKSLASAVLRVTL